VNKKNEIVIEMENWNLNLEDNSQSQCTHCSRNRVSLCLNGKHRCEKCNYSPEEKRIITDEEIEHH
jgi:ribosomal protein L37AE/L43A